MVRTKLPSRRHSWCQKVNLEGQKFYLTIGEYESGQPGEIFLDASKQGTFTRGILDALARVVSVSLQCGTPLEEICNALKGLNFPPQGMILGSDSIMEVSSVTDWIAKELASVYLTPKQEESEQPIVEKAAGIAPEPWRSGI